MRSKTGQHRPTLDLGAIEPGAVGALIARILDAAGLDRDARVEVLGGALVSEAVRPYWESGCPADAAHARLQAEDPELAEIIETLAPALLGRAEARAEAAAAIDLVQRLLARR